MTHDQELDALIAKWLGKANDQYYNELTRMMYRECADELAALQAAKREPVVSPNVIAHDNPMFRPYCFIVEPHRSDDCSWPWNVHKTEAECERDLEDGRVIVPVYRHPALKHPLPEATHKMPLPAQPKQGESND